MVQIHMDTCLSIIDAPFSPGIRGSIEGIGFVEVGPAGLRQGRNPIHIRFDFVPLSIRDKRVKVSIMAKRTSQTSTSSEPLMLYEHSIPVSLEQFKDQDYFSLFTPRIHRNLAYADDGSWQCQVDFLDATAAARAGADRNRKNWSYAVGCINPRAGNFTALCACEALPERLALISYMVEYAFIHDDGKPRWLNESLALSIGANDSKVLDYAEDQREAKVSINLLRIQNFFDADVFQLWEANRELTDGLNPERATNDGTKDHVRNRQLQAKMPVELLILDRQMWNECLRLWKEMTDTFINIRLVDFKDLEEYLGYRIVDAGCP